MLGRRKPQRSLFEAQAWLHRVPADSFYTRLGAVMEQLFSDPHSQCSWGKCDDLAELYYLDNGRPSLPPSLMSGILLLQFYDEVSDAEATRTRRWGHALSSPKFADRRAAVAASDEQAEPVIDLVR